MKQYPDDRAQRTSGYFFAKTERRNGLWDWNGRITVDIGTEEFMFDVMWRMDNEEFDECYAGSAQQLHQCV